MVATTCVKANNLGSPLNKYSLEYPVLPVAVARFQKGLQDRTRTYKLCYDDHQMVWAELADENLTISLVRMTHLICLNPLFFVVGNFMVLAHFIVFVVLMMLSSLMW